MVWVIVLSVFILSGCGRGKTYEKLREADKIADSNPVEALKVLESVNYEDLKGENLAWCALLMTKVQDKNYLYEDNDNLILKAKNYYEGKGDSLEVQSLYYTGYIQTMNEQYDKALISLTEAYEKAISTNDEFYAGMSARAISSIYGELSIFSEKLNWAKSAKKHFEKISKKEHASWMDLMTADALIGLNRIDSAKQILNNVDTLYYSLNPYFKTNVDINKIKISNIEDRYDDVLEMYLNLYEDGYEPSASDHLNLANAYLRLLDYEKAHEEIEKARKSKMNKTDSLYLSYLNSHLSAAKMNYFDAFIKSSRLEKDLIIEGDIQRTNPTTHRLTEHLKIKYENEKLKAERNSSYLLLIITGSILLLILAIFAILYFRLRSIRHSLDLMDQIKSLKKELEETKDSENKIIAELHQEKSQAEVLHKEVITQISKNTDIVNALFSIWYKYLANENEDSEAHNSSRFRKETVGLIGKLRMKNNLEDLLHTIQSHDSGLLGKFRSEKNDMSKQEYLLIAYRYAGLRYETIALLLGYKTSDGARAAMYRLKNKLKNEDSPVISELLEKI